MTIIFSHYYISEHALLIGGTRGIGFGTAQALAKAGAHVTIVGRSKNNGAKAVSTIQDLSKDGGSVQFVQGDLGTVCSSLALADRLASQDTRYDFAVVTAAIFPDWTQPLQNEDGLDKSIAIAVVGRWIMYRNMYRFMKNDENSRILNVLASGEKLPARAVAMFDKDIVTGKRNVSSLFEAMMNFAISNEIVVDSLHTYDEHFSKFTMVSTHPGLLKTDLHRGQGLAFDIFEYIIVLLVGRSVEDAGNRQTSILVNQKLHPLALTLVDQFEHGRNRDPVYTELIEQNRDWLWQFLLSLEKKECGSNIKKV